MRKVSSKIAEAFKARKPAKMANTNTDGHGFYLHGNRIAEWRGSVVCKCGWQESGRSSPQSTCPKCLKQSPRFIADELWISSAGWNTSTTRERLNAILRTLQTSWCVYQQEGQLHFKGKPWDGGWIKVL